jgi:hypothetical protein
LVSQPVAGSLATERLGCARYGATCCCVLLHRLHLSTVVFCYAGYPCLLLCFVTRATPVRSCASSSGRGLGLHPCCWYGGRLHLRQPRCQLVDAWVRGNGPVQHTWFASALMVRRMSAFARAPRHKLVDASAAMVQYSALLWAGQELLG